MKQGNELTATSTNNDGSKSRSNDLADSSFRSECKVFRTARDAGLVPTLAVIFWLGWMSILVYSSIYCLFFSSRTTTKCFVTICAISMLLPRHFPGVYGKRIGNWIMTQAEKYFGLTATIEDYEALQTYSSQNKPVIFAVEPHDVLPYGVFAFNPGLKYFPGKVGDTCSVLMSSAVFYIPFIKQVYSWVGVDPVCAKTFRSKLERSQPLAFIPGGVQEILLMDPANPSDILMYLNTRKGFIKMALEYGAPIVPVFIFYLDGRYDWWFPGENTFLEGLSRKIGFVPLLFTGRFGIPFFIPKPKQLHLVCGKAIEVPLMPSTTTSQEELQASMDKYHALFCQEMLKLYDRHKVEAGYAHRKLLVV